MVGKNRNLILIVFIVCFFILSSIPFGVFASQIEESTLEVQSEHVMTLIDDLPIDLDTLFSLDNFTEFEIMLDKIEAYTDFWPIRPYGTFFGHGHHEGLARMDLNPHRLHAEIRAPVDCSLVWFVSINGTTDFVNGYECEMDTGIVLNIGNHCWLSLGHVNILKTISDEIETTGNISLSKGDLIGFTYTVYDKSIVDFSYYYRGILIPPYYAFTPKLLGKVEVLYDFLYDRAKLNGLYPRARMINEMNIHKDDEFWGNWYYKTGPYDSYIDPDEHISGYDFGVLTFINREFTTPETYWKDKINPTKNITDDILGVGKGVHYGVTPGFKAISEGYIRLAEGDNTSGIMEFKTHYGSDYGPYNTSIYGKFEMIVNSTGFKSDELQIEFFPTLGEAQSGFTANVSTYYRIYTPTIDDIELPPTFEGIIFIYPTIFSAIIISIITRKKKK